MSAESNLLLVPLRVADVPRLQQVYEACADYFQLVGRTSTPAHMAERVMLEVETTPGRHVMGITLNDELIGLLDFRLRYPAPDVAQLGLILIVPGERNRGYGTLAMDIWETWLDVQTPIARVRAAVVAHNRGAQRFFLRRQYHLTGETYRMPVGRAQPRVLVMEKFLGLEPPVRGKGG